MLDPRGLSAVPESFARPYLACGLSAPSSPHFTAAASAARPLRRLLASTTYKWFSPPLSPWRSSRVQGGRCYVAKVFIFTLQILTHGSYKRADRTFLV